MLICHVNVHAQQIDGIQSTLDISKSKGLSEILQDIRTSTYQILSRKHIYITDPLKPHFYVAKLGFRGVYIIFR